MFTDAMAKKKEEIIYLPDDAETAALADRFEQRYAYPQAFAAIDGSHIPVTPFDGYRDFINRKMYPSIILQAVCNDKYIFRNIFAKLPGCCHDAHVSLIPHFLIICTCCPGEIVIDGSTVPVHTLGDLAYPLLTGLKYFTKYHKAWQKEFSLMDQVYSDINSAFCTICKTQFSTGAMNSRAPGYDIFVFVFLLIILLRDNLNLDSCISLYIHYI